MAWDELLGVFIAFRVAPRLRFPRQECVPPGAKLDRIRDPVSSVEGDQKCHMSGQVVYRNDCAAPYVSRVVRRYAVCAEH